MSRFGFATAEIRIQDDLGDWEVGDSEDSGVVRVFEY
jgi:hypothetical protein